jgi:hypothetical protein
MRPLSSSRRRSSWPGKVRSLSAWKSSGNVIPKLPATLVAGVSRRGRAHRYPNSFGRPGGRPLVRCSEGLAYVKSGCAIERIFNGTLMAPAKILDC